MRGVRRVEGALETVGEVAITSLGAVPPRMQMEPAAQKLSAKPLCGKADAGLEWFEIEGKLG